MIKKTILVWFCLILAGFCALSQDLNDAVVYIQSDKETPIYVKVEGRMMERYSKNYVVLGNLASGPLNLEILFQQNKYPNQKFILNIPPSSQRSLVLKKLDQNKFALYDLNYGIYLNNGNRLEEDISGSDNDYQNTVLAANNRTEEAQPPKETAAAQPKKEKVVAQKTKKEKNTEESIPEFTAAKVKEEKKKKSEALEVAQAVPENNDTPKPAKRKRADREQEKEAKTEQERFLDFEMDKKEGNTGNSKSAKNTSANHNGKCTEAATESQFDNFASLLNATEDEEQKLVIVRKNAPKYCFSTDQVRTIAMNFDSQSSRYEVTRVLKAKVVDAENYPKLSSLFNTNYLKERFKNEVVDK
ncbi:MAG: hypothetical protein BGO31_04760 [Bacteroidetes bacterium 43-16]|nr:MAG: hypothetical protein BGO31_04760 [Bacteroidetes bacterium 43-16]